MGCLDDEMEARMRVTKKEEIWEKLRVLITAFVKSLHYSPPVAFNSQNLEIDSQDQFLHQFL